MDAFERRIHGAVEEYIGSTECGTCVVDAVAQHAHTSHTSNHTKHNGVERRQEACAEWTYARACHLRIEWHLQHLVESVGGS